MATTFVLGLVLLLGAELCAQGPAVGNEVVNTLGNSQKSEADREHKLSAHYRKWIDEDVVYIIKQEEKIRFLSLGTDEEREYFIEQFWARRNSNQRSSRNAFREEHYRRIAYANKHFASRLPGWETDRGRVYITCGMPDKITSYPKGKIRQPNEINQGVTYPFEVWWYQYVYGIGDDIELVFVDQDGNDEYRLAMPPEEKEAFFKPSGL